MEQITPSVNLVVYLLAGVATLVKKHSHFLGGHGYTYDVNEEGKKKLVKDVPTSSGYYAGNVQKANTVVTVQDIVCLTVAKKDSMLEALLTGYLDVLRVFVDDPKMKNLCVVTQHKELEALCRMKLSEVEKAPEVKLGKELLTPIERALLEDILRLSGDLAEHGHVVMFDLPGSVEGGLGNREASKMADLANAITVYDFNKPNNLERIPRKEYENPDILFNKLVDASRWYFETGSPESFYDLFHGYRVYNFGKVEPDKSYYGKLTPDVTYCKLYTKKPCLLLDKLFDFTVRKIDNPDGYLSAGDLNNIVTKDLARLIDQVPAIPDGNKELVSPLTKQNGKPTLVELINPVHMSYRIRDFLIGMDVIFEAFTKRNAENVSGYSTFYDITDMIYVKEVNGKGVEKLKLHPDFTQTKETFKVKVHHPNSKKPVPITLSIGYDCPTRNSFNAVEDPNVKVWVVTDTRNQQGLRFATLVVTEEFTYVQTSAVANLRVLTLSELGKAAE